MMSETDRLTPHTWYRLPDGERLHAQPLPGGRWALFTYDEWRSGRDAATTLEPDGRITRHARPTDWTVSDLERLDEVLL